jgi:RNA polymerase sigma-70 factor (ECF subfamily)
MEDRDTAELTLAVPLARAGDAEAFRVLYRSVQPRLLRYLKGMVGTGDAEDVASEAWVQIARDLGSFVGDGDAFRGWAATIARHRALDHLRRLRRRPVTPVPVEAFEYMIGDEDPAAEAITAVETDAAIAMIATLPRDQAEAVLMRAVMGLDAATAGQVLGKSAGAVRVAAHRGLRTLAGRLRDGRLDRLPVDLGTRPDGDGPAHA